MWLQVLAVLVRSSVQARIKPSAKCDGGDLGFPLGSLGAAGFCFHSVLEQHVPQFSFLA